MKKKVLVVGGSGFLGSHVADELTEKGFEVTILDQNKSQWINNKQKFIKTDLLDREQIIKNTEGFNFVLHFAGIADIGESKEKPLDTIETNILGTVNLLEGCRKNKVEKFIFASSVYVFSKYGSFYGKSKQACELLIEEYQNEFAKIHARTATTSWLTVRLARNFLLSETDHVLLSDAPYTADEIEMYKKYRKKLRDLPAEANTTDPTGIKFPIPPKYFTDIYLKKDNFPWLTEYYPWPVMADDSFSCIQLDEGCKAKHNYNKGIEIV